MQQAGMAADMAYAAARQNEFKAKLRMREIISPDLFWKPDA